MGADETSLAIQEEMQSNDLWYAPRESVNVKTEILKRRRKVAEMWNMQNLSVAETAKRLDVSPATVSNDRRALLDMWQTVVEADVIEIVARELQKLEVQEAELWSAWKQSREDIRDDTTERNIKQDGTQAGATLVRERRTSRTAEAKFMDLILRCQERRAKLLGLDKAVTFEAASFSFAMFVEQSYEAAAKLRKGPDTPLGPTIDIPSKPPKALPEKKPKTLDIPDRPEETDE